MAEAIQMNRELDGTKLTNEHEEGKFRPPRTVNLTGPGLFWDGG